MQSTNWQLTTPISAIIFDCDGTLSTIEGIDYLAKENHVYEKVSRLTEKAMGETGLTKALYQERLAYVRPTSQQITALGKAYVQHLLPQCAVVINLLQTLGKAIYILSAGLQPAVEALGKTLNIPSQHIHAVNISFNAKGEYAHFDENSPLVTNEGKRFYVTQIKRAHERILYVGDGMNDMAVKDLVTRFVGFGGAFYREKIAKASDFYITNYLALLPLALTQKETLQLEPASHSLFSQGLGLIKSR